VHILRPSVKMFFLGIAFPVLLFLLFPQLLWPVALWVLAAHVKFFYEIADWFFDSWLVTNLSVIDVEWNGFFHKSSSRIEFADIEEISWEVKGFLGTVLGFGNCEMVCANSKILLENCASPKKVELKVHELREKFLHEKKMTD